MIIIIFFLRQCLLFLNAVFGFFFLKETELLFFVSKINLGYNKSKKLLCRVSGFSSPAEKINTHKIRIPLKRGASGRFRRKKKRRIRGEIMFKKKKIKWWWGDTIRWDSNKNNNRDKTSPPKKKKPEMVIQKESSAIWCMYSS